jgi:hypothetical protein
MLNETSAKIDVHAPDNPVTRTKDAFLEGFPDEIDREQSSKGHCQVIDGPEKNVLPAGQSASTDDPGRSSDKKVAHEPEHGKWDPGTKEHGICLVFDMHESAQPSQDCNHRRHESQIFRSCEILHLVLQNSDLRYSQTTLHIITILNFCQYKKHPSIKECFLFGNQYPHLWLVDCHIYEITDFIVLIKYPNTFHFTTISFYPTFALLIHQDLNFLVLESLIVF